MKERGKKEKTRTDDAGLSKRRSPYIRRRESPLEGQEHERTAMMKVRFAKRRIVLSLSLALSFVFVRSLFLAQPSTTSFITIFSPIGYVKATTPTSKRSLYVLLPFTAYFGRVALTARYRAKCEDEGKDGRKGRSGNNLVSSV